MNRRDGANGPADDCVAVFDQDNSDEGGFLADVEVRLPRRRRTERARVPQSGPLGNTIATPASTRMAPAQRAQTGRGLLLPLMVLTLSALGIVWFGYDRLIPAALNGQVPTSTAPTVLPSASTTALIMQIDGSGSPVSLAAASLTDDGDSSMVFMPVSMLVEVPGFGLDTIVAAGEYGGVDLAALAVENLLTIDFDHTIVLTSADMTELVRSFDPLLVENPRRLDEATVRDRVRVVYPSGAILLPASDSADFLERQALNETGLQRLVRHQEFWTALFAARSEVVVELRDIDADAEHFLDELSVRSEQIEYRIIDVDVIAGEDEFFGVNRDSLDELIIRLDPARAFGGLVRTRVQLLNGVGVPGLGAPIASLVNGVAASIELVGNAANFDHEVTQVVFYRDEQREAALRIRGALGVGEVVKQLDAIDVVDVTIVVGADLVATLGILTQDAVAVVTE
ncbi:MAG: LCP family protein [Actinobacteria bacterium]|nr:LCP family protein [Actinomycetota bacterium]